MISQSWQRTSYSLCSGAVSFAGESLIVNSSLVSTLQAQKTLP